MGHGINCGFITLCLWVDKSCSGIQTLGELVNGEKLNHPFHFKIIQILTKTLDCPHVPEMRTEDGLHSAGAGKTWWALLAVWACRVCISPKWDAGTPWLVWCPPAGKAGTSAQSQYRPRFVWKPLCTLQANLARVCAWWCALATREVRLKRKIFQVPSKYLAPYADSQLLQSSYLIT